MSLYDIPVATLAGEPGTLAPYRGKVLLIVNVASHCGYTPQYKGLERMHRELGPRGFAVLGFPCNQFGDQEPGEAEEIQQFCSLTYDVTFPLFEKVEVNGPNAHPLWELLKRARRGFLGTRSIKWNFTKFLVDRSGKVLKRYGTKTSPREIARDVERLLG
ncbi:MAG: glutathione peroxidase [Gemmatimonadales bacterium]|nr:glutathione peroxidase [Gemmatimonadota bacterium]MCL4214947.1 glutathione peroxidase [Gemmatimonadales bacterium]